MRNQNDKKVTYIVGIISDNIKSHKLEQNIISDKKKITSHR